MKHVVALLESMWDWRAMTSGAGYDSAPRWFRINPANKSGRVLYRLVGAGAHLLVTNACRELVASASQHGTPDPAWVRANLAEMEQRGHMDLLLVCGTVAQATFATCGFQPRCPVLQINHPAARGRQAWSHARVDAMAAVIALVLRDGRPSEAHDA